MKRLTIVIILLLASSLLFARITKEQVVGQWKLISKKHYLVMVFNRKGFVRITEGDSKHKPQLLPLGIWSTLDDSLKITIAGKIKFQYRSVKFHGRKITVRNRHGKHEHFRYTPPAE